MTTAMVKQEDGAGLVRREFNRDEIDLIKRTVAVGATDAELKLFLYTCQRRGLDPLAKQIHFVKRKRKNYDSGQWEEYGVIQTGIDGFRLIAERTGRYDGQLGPLWCGEDGRWVDVWLAKEPPAAAKVGVLKRGWREPIWAVARWAAYVQTTSNGAPNTMWTKMGAEMLAKCAEVLALRKALPEDLSGVYSNDEMMQADNTPVVVERVTGEVVDAEPPAVVSKSDAGPRPRVSHMSLYQREKLAELCRDVYGDAPDIEVQAQLDNLFMEQFGHGMGEATYNEGAVVASQLLAKQRERAAASTEPEPVAPDSAPAPDAAKTPDWYRAEYRRLVAKAVELGAPLVKGGKELPGSIDNIQDAAKVQAAYEYVRGLVIQAEQITQAA